MTKAASTPPDEPVEVPEPPTPVDDAETRVDTHRPPNVIAAIARVEAEIGGIAKRTPQERGRSGEGVSYPYRGIDEIAQAAQPLLGRYGIVIVPTVENHVIDEVTVANKPWTDTTVIVLWTIYGPGGVDDKIESRTVGYGRDNSDKGMNKAMTGAYKNLLLRILTIGDPRDDTDGTTHEADGLNGRAPVDENLPPKPKDPRVEAAFKALGELTDDQKAEVKALAEEYGHKVTEKSLAENPDWLDVIEAYLHRVHTAAIAERQRQRIAEELAAMRHGEEGEDAGEETEETEPDVHDIDPDEPEADEPLDPDEPDDGGYG